MKEYFKVPNTCGECRFISHYKYGPYARNPHCCCELMWTLEEVDYKVKEDRLDENCPLKDLCKDDAGCGFCSADYHQEIKATLIRYHTSGDQSVITIPVYYCPKCGRKLNTRGDGHE